MWTCSQRRSCARRRRSWRHLSLWQLITDEKADVSCAGVVTCSCVGGHGVCIRCRTCELCLPRLRWTLQHSSQINTPLFTEAQRGSEKEERKKNHKVKIMTLSAIWLMNHSRRKVLFKEQLKAKYLILWLAPAWCALNSRGRVRWKKVSQVVTSHSVTSFESLTCFCGSKHHNSPFLSLFLTDRKPRNSYLRQTFEGLGRAYFANIVCYSCSNHSINPLAHQNKINHQLFWK